MVALKKAPALKSSTETSTAVSAPPGPLAITISDRKGLASILATLATVADAKSTMTILGHVAIRTGLDGSTLIATDLNVYATYRAPAWIGGRGGRALPAKQVADIVKRLPRNEVSIRGTEHGIAIESGKVQTSLLGLPDRDFPSVPDTDGLEWSGVQVADVLTVLRPTIGAVCLDETRFHLNGVSLESEDGYLVASATDGHRLHKAKVPSSWRLPKGMIVPTRALKLLIRTLAPGAFESAFRGPYWFVRQGGWTFAIKLIDAQFPPTDGLIPKSSKRFITVQRDNFVRSLERAKIYATDVRGVHLKVTGKDELTIISDNPDAGTTKEVIPCEVDFADKEFSIGANVRYLIESLKAIDDDRVTFGVVSELEPMLVRGSEDMGTRPLDLSALVCVVMPMRI